MGRHYHYSGSLNARYPALSWPTPDLNPDSRSVVTDMTHPRARLWPVYTPSHSPPVAAQPSTQPWWHPQGPLLVWLCIAQCQEKHRSYSSFVPVVVCVKQYSNKYIYGPHLCVCVHVLVCVHVSLCVCEHACVLFLRCRTWGQMCRGVCACVCMCGGGGEGGGGCWWVFFLCVNSIY